MFSTYMRSLGLPTAIKNIKRPSRGGGGILLLPDRLRLMPKKLKPRNFCNCS